MLALGGVEATITGQRAGAQARAIVGQRVSPFMEQRANEAFRFAVGLRPIGLGAVMAQVPGGVDHTA